MARDIDLTRGGYGGDVIEEDFKWFTSQHMEYWWHFREVLRAADKKSVAHWKMSDGSTMTDDDHKKLVAVSLLNYSVYTGLVEAFSFFLDMRNDVAHNNIFNTRRAWKALYSSLYGSLNAFSNLVYVVVCNKSPFGKNSATPRSPTVGEIIKELNRKALSDISVKDIAQTIKKCDDRMEIRNQLDHWWTIWTTFVPTPSGVKFKLDYHFTKGYILLDPEKDIDWNLAFDASQRAIDEITGCAEDFNRIYKEMAVTGGYLDTYLLDNGWEIDYSDYGSPHNRQRPTP